MKIFGIKDNEKELYFQLEKKEGLKIISKISYKLFGEDGYIHEDRWQSGLTEEEDYTGFEKDGIYMAVVISKERIHIIIKGLSKKDKINIKELVLDKYQFQLK